MQGVTWPCMCRWLWGPDRGSSDSCRDHPLGTAAGAAIHALHAQCYARVHTTGEIVPGFILWLCPLPALCFGQVT